MSETFFFLGYDPAPALSAQADDGSMAVLRAIDRRNEVQRAERTPVVTDFQCDYVYARILRNQSPRACSGHVYGLHDRFGLSSIVLDGGGGGLGIFKEMQSTRQVVGGVEREVTPIVSRDSTEFVHAQFILSLFRRKDPAIRKLWGCDHMSGDDELVAAMHGAFAEAVNNTWFGLPPVWEEMRGEEQRAVGWQSERFYALKVLNKGCQQLAQVSVLTNEEGVIQTSRRGARQFRSPSRKDVAYSMLYAWTAFLSWLCLYAEDVAVRPEDGVMFGG